MAGAEAKRSDLGVRALSAIVMVAIAGTALWLGGPVFNLFALAVGLGVYWEWSGLVRGFASGPVSRLAWMLAGLGYIGQAVAALIALRHSGLWPSALLLLAVIAVDVGAYFAGRLIGGPRIAPKISPSKTWAGLGGGILGASLVNIGASWMLRGTMACDTEGWACTSNAGLILEGLVVGTLVAVVAQAGDFFESWMKRRAGVKDSGSLIPGHGGLFDRVDGLIAVLCLIALTYRFA